MLHTRPAPGRPALASLPRLAPLLLLGCSLLTFDVEESTSTTVEGAGILGAVLGTVAFTGLDDFDVEIAQALADQGAEPGDLRSVTLTRLHLAGTPDLEFLESMDIYVSAEGVPEVLVATGDAFDAGATEIDLTMTGANMAAAVEAGGMQFRVQASGAAPVEDTDIDVEIAVRVEATGQGACNAAVKSK